MMEPRPLQRPIKTNQISEGGALILIPIGVSIHCIKPHNNKTRKARKERRSANKMAPAGADNVNFQFNGTKWSERETLLCSIRDVIFTPRPAPGRFFAPPGYVTSHQPWRHFTRLINRRGRLTPFIRLLWHHADPNSISIVIYKSWKIHTCHSMGNYGQFDVIS